MSIVLKLFITGALIIVSGLLCLLVVILLHRLLRVRRDRTHTIQLRNEGNIPSVYLLSIHSTEPALRFKLLSNNIPLVAAPAPAQPEDLAAAPEQASRRPAPSASAPKSGNAVKSAAQGGRAVASKVGFVASFLGVLGSLIPGELGSSLRARGAQARELQSSTTEAVQAPVSAQRNVESLQQMSGGFGVKTGGNGSSPSGNNQKLGPQNPPPGSATRPKNSSSGQAYAVQTSEIQPGGAQLLTLAIACSKRRYPQGSFLYTVWSQQVPVDPINIEIPPVRRNGTIHFEHIAAWRYWLSPLAGGAFILILLMVMTYFLLLIW